MVALDSEVQNRVQELRPFLVGELWRCHLSNGKGRLASVHCQEQLVRAVLVGDQIPTEKSAVIGGVIDQPTVTRCRYRLDPVGDEAIHLEGRRQQIL